MNRHLALIAAIWLLCSGCSADRDLPRPYRNMVVPEARLQSDEARRRGEQLYQANCALCHGARLDGKGIRRANLNTPPRDFTDSQWQLTTSPRRMFFMIREGVPGTAMPAWKSLDEAETWDLVAYLRTPAATTDRPSPGPARPPDSR
jgi:mono/diheme cytochrome c family protein